jgi:predicted phosphodiesterase
VYAGGIIFGSKRQGGLMRLQVLSDLHMEAGDYTPEQTDADVVILAGDINVGCGGIQWAKEHFPDQPVIYVMGNHEFYGGSISGVFKEFRTATATGNVCLLENQSVQIGGFTFLGSILWTDFKLWHNTETAMLAAGKFLRDFHVIKTGSETFQPEDSLMIHTVSAGWLKHQLGKCNPEKTVVITHHAPSEKSIPPHLLGDILNAAFSSPLDGFVENSRVPLWIHGHTHHSVDYKIGQTRVFSNQRGYPYEVDPKFVPGAVVEV